MSSRVGAVALVALLSLALAYALASASGAARRPSGPPSSAASSPSPRSLDGTEAEARREGDREREGLAAAPPASEDYACLVPALPIAREPACARGEAYPACRWWLPDEEVVGGLYTIWRNTTPEHRAARPALVALVLASAREYARRWPGEHVTIGDLDAAGPRHQSHQDGADVDLYLEHAMAVRNEPGRAPIDNYRGLSRDAVALHRARVLDLAKIVARCARGRVLMYYADRPVVDAFRSWFERAGLTSDLSSRPMQMHNALHRFHIHLRVPPDLATLPGE